MRYGFINNFSQSLAADLAAGATTMTLDGGGSLLSAASADLVYALTLDDGEGTTEIVHVTAASGDTLTIERGKEGTADAAWSSGTTVEMRVTAGVMGSMAMNLSPLLLGPVAGEFPAGITSHLDLGTAWSENGEGTILVGESMAIDVFNGAANTLMSPLVIGAWNTLYNDNGYNPIVIGADIETKPGGEEFVLIGTGAGFGGGTTSVGNQQVVAIGAGATATQNYTVTLGAYANANGDYTTTVGHQALGYGVHCAIHGAGAQTFYDYASLVGASSEAGAAFAAALGFGANAGQEGTFVCSAMSAVPNEARASEFDANGAPGTCMRSAQQVVLRSDTLDLSAASEFELTLPSGVVLFLDEIDVVALGAVSGSPEVSAGTTTGGVDLAPATPLTVTAANERQSIAPATAHGVTGSVFFNVVTTGSGSVRVMLKGYALQA